MDLRSWRTPGEAGGGWSGPCPALAVRHELGDHGRGQFEVLAHVAVQGAEAPPVLASCSDGAAAQEMRQMVDVAAEDGQLAGGGVERGKARGALDRRDDRRRGVDQAHQVGPRDSPAARPFRSRRWATSRDTRTDSLTCLVAGEPLRRSAMGVGETTPASPRATARALRSTSDSVRPSRAARADSAARRPRRSTVKYSRGVADMMKREVESGQHRTRPSAFPALFSFFSPSLFISIIR